MRAKFIFEYLDVLAPRSNNAIAELLPELTLEEKNKALMNNLKSPGITKMLIKNGADVNATVNGNTALTLCVTYSYAHMVKLLLQLGADPNLEAGDINPLNLAVWKNL